MAARDPEVRPIQVFPDTRQFITIRKSRPRGGRRDFFKGDDEGFMRHTAHMRRKIRGAAESLRFEGHPAGFLMVRMRATALGESHRPLNALFSRGNGFSLVGGADIGEMFFQCTPETLARLDGVIGERLEPRPKAGPAREAGGAGKRASSLRSELGGVEDIRLPGPADRVRFSAREAVRRLKRPEALGGYVVELFRPDGQIEPDAVRETVGRFRGRLAGVGGVVATPAMGSRSSSGGSGSPALSAHLVPEADGGMIRLPFSEEVSGIAEPGGPGTAPASSSGRDLSVERHRGLLEMLAVEPMVRWVDLPAIMVVASF